MFIVNSLNFSFQFFDRNTVASIKPCESKVKHTFAYVCKICIHTHSQLWLQRRCSLPNCVTLNWIAVVMNAIQGDFAVIKSVIIKRVHLCIQVCSRIQIGSMWKQLMGHRNMFRLENLSVCVEVLRPSQQLRSSRAGQLPINTVPMQV